ncbi:MAG: 1-deoxy-D-xylulose-5-phosphate reductoisomerase [Candidatus Tantalella remota]|nr:1-deoxy-D-xylulose-5-phosphate reductoisomerase [Candidatus Tantalella remota]
MKDIILLGSTGSVGRNVLEIARSYPDKFRIKAISSNRNIDSLSAQAAEFKPDIVAVGKKDLKDDLAKRINYPCKVVAGEEGLEYLAAEESADIVFMAISGTAALKPLVLALEKGRKVALASKEPIVSAGSIIQRMVEKSHGVILPVDSEHSAVAQCLAGRRTEEVRTLYLTGSGGPLKDKAEKSFDSLSIGQILDHPKWDMGPKITVDSATLMNKGLEVIEARWLFDVPPEKIKVVIQPQAIIHAMVEFVDGVVSAGMFCPDMRFPILRALSHPQVIASDLERLDFAKVGNLSFLEPDTVKFPALELAFEALRVGGTMPAVLNSANEKAVTLFLDGKIKFTNIVKLVQKTMENHKNIEEPLLEDIIETEKWAAEEVLRSC